jgi:hypothetical protein
MLFVCTSRCNTRKVGGFCFVQRGTELRAKRDGLENATQNGRLQRCLMIGFLHPISFTASFRHRTLLAPKVASIIAAPGVQIAPK